MAKEKAKAAGPSLNDVYNKVAAKSDTEGVHINVAETKRVIACLLDALEDLPASDAQQAEQRINQQQVASAEASISRNSSNWRIGLSRISPREITRFFAEPNTTLAIESSPLPSWS